MKSSISPRIAILCLALIGLVLTLSGRAAGAAPPRAITLLYFEGQGLPDAVLLRWATGSEYETAGFRLERAETVNGTYQPLEQIGFIPAEGSGLMGAEYEATDADGVLDGQAYWYVLYEIENDGSENTAGPIRVFAGLATATPTATATTAATSEPPATTAPTDPPPTELPANAPSTPTPLPTTAAGATAVPSPTRGAATEGTGGTAAGQTQAVGQVQAPTPPPGYPPAGEATQPAQAVPPDALQSPPADYPPAAATVAPLPEGSAVPGFPGVVQPGGTPLRATEPTRPAASLGTAAGDAGATQTEQVGPGPSTGVVLFLWVGFILALVVFIISVFGSIILFTRQRMQAR